MKNQNAVGLLVACMFAFQSISAQQQPPVILNPKPVLSRASSVGQLPPKLECNFSVIKGLSARRIADKIDLALGNFEFSGELVERVQSSPNVMNMNIRSTSMPGTFCSISVITQNDNTEKLVGTIINPKADEVLVLTEENNRYFWVKKQKQFFLVE
ncbi:hypothetical protein A4H97_06785 [Niastella yeongjuensis]|uniref:Uncharacterized protein n=1 Tax=Niastella yeongjuensis TaxID=354355 RepID=A0A1V9EM59_9BACT|nr:hypothetical protein [Niastella yeongjuensis]OQP47206.1 hypothetical protein A4H97_06785 [Niastella yeongjuensis]SEN74098.1 hypothetical protein SAMN05660816_01383 [Niastella yeongjuensis]